VTRASSDLLVAGNGSTDVSPQHPDGAPHTEAGRGPSSGMHGDSQWRRLSNQNGPGPSLTWSGVRVLPVISDVCLHLTDDHARCRIDLVTDRDFTPTLAVDARKALLPALPEMPVVEDIRLIQGPLDEDAAKAQLDMPFDERPVRDLLLAVVWVFHHRRLCHCAGRCLMSPSRETMLTTDDLIQAAGWLTLAGGLEWHGSLEMLVRSMFTTMVNLSRDHKRFERRILLLEENDYRLPPVMADADWRAFLTLLNGDLERELAALPAAQRAVLIDRYVKGMTPREIAAASVKALQTVQNQLAQAKATLRKSEVLAAYISEWKTAAKTRPCGSAITIAGAGKRPVSKRP